MHSGVDQDGVNELRDAHVLQHLAHVRVGQVVAVLRARRRRAASGPRRAVTRSAGAPPLGQPGVSACRRASAPPDRNARQGAGRSCAGAEHELSAVPGTR